MIDIIELKADFLKTKQQIEDLLAGNQKVLDLIKAYNDLLEECKKFHEIRKDLEKKYDGIKSLLENERNLHKNLETEFSVDTDTKNMMVEFLKLWIPFHNTPHSTCACVYCCKARDLYYRLTKKEFKFGA